MLTDRSTIGDDLDWCQGFLHDAVATETDGSIWTRAELLDYYREGYQQLLAAAESVQRFWALDMPSLLPEIFTFNEDRDFTRDGPGWQFGWLGPGGYVATTLGEITALEGYTASGGTGITFQWEREYVNPTEVHYRIALPRDQKRLVKVWYDNELLLPVSVRELDNTWQHWMSREGEPQAWTLGTGPLQTMEVYEIVTDSNPSYTHDGQEFGRHGIPRSFSGSRTYASVLEHGLTSERGIPRAIWSSQRQYHNTNLPIGRPFRWGSSDGQLMLLEVITPDVPYLRESDRPWLIPKQMQKYLCYYVLSQAFNRQGEGYQSGMAAFCGQRAQRGVALLRQLGWLGRYAQQFARQGIIQYVGRPPRPRLPSAYPRDRWS